jgi:hypothetical protein
MNKELEKYKQLDRLVLAEVNIKSFNRACKTRDYNGDLSTFELRFDGNEYTYWYQDKLCPDHIHDKFEKEGLTLQILQGSVV